MITIKRIYEPASPKDGYRVLIDRLWPRGVAKTEAALDDWIKDIAPSTQLRQWFNHQPDRFAEFSRRYRHELATNPAVERLCDLIRNHKTVTLLYGSRDPHINHAIVLEDYLGR